MLDFSINSSILQLPTEEESFERAKQETETDLVNFHHWFKPQNSQFHVPRSTWFLLTFDERKLFRQEKEEADAEQVKQFNEHCDRLVKENNLNYPVFMKSGLFSNKFEFDNCVVNSPDEFFEKFYNIEYFAMMFGVRPTLEVVLREFIQVPTEMKLYTNMPMHLELRAFVNFDTNEVIEVIDYWHESIVENLPLEQQDAFIQHKQKMQNKFLEMRNVVTEKLKLSMNNGDFSHLSGKWSVDFMLDEKDDIWLIDMAVANQSWGYHLIQDLIQE